MTVTAHRRTVSYDTCDAPIADGVCTRHAGHDGDCMNENATWPPTDPIARAALVVGTTERDYVASLGQGPATKSLKMWATCHATSCSAWTYATEAHPSKGVTIERHFDGAGQAIKPQRVVVGWPDIARHIRTHRSDTHPEEPTVTATDALAPPARYVTEIPIDELHPVDHNRDLGPREGLEGMAATMQHLGVLEPLLVRSRPGNGYEIIAGARRHAAAAIAGLTTVPCLIENDRDDQQVELARAIENLQRKDLTVIEEAQVYERLSKPPFNLTMEAIGDSVGRTKSHVSKRCSLLLLPPEAQAAVADQRINIQTALGMTALARDRARLDKIVDKIPDVESSTDRLERERQELDRALARELEDQARVRRVAAKVEELDQAGETIVDYPLFGNWADTGYRVTRGDEPHEAVAVDPVSERVVHVTTQPLPDSARQTTTHRPPKPDGDIGFVEQAQRKRTQEAAERAVARRAVATRILNEPGHDVELGRYVYEAVIGCSIGDDQPIDYGLTPTVRALLGFGDDDPTLLEYASRTDITRLRTAAAAVMAGAESELTRPRMSALRPGSWADPDDADAIDDAAHLRRYLALLVRNGYELPDDEQAALTPVSGGNTDES